MATFQTGLEKSLKKLLPIWPKIEETIKSNQLQK